MLSLEWLRDRSAEEARAYLMSIDGMTSAHDHSIPLIWICQKGQLCISL